MNPQQPSLRKERIVPISRMPRGLNAGRGWWPGMDWQAEAAMCKTQSDGDSVVLMSYFGILTRMVYYCIFFWEKERPEFLEV